MCDPRQDPGLSVLDGMSSLVDKSLVRALDADSAEPRFTMLETVRDYAFERLVTAGEAPSVQKAHAAYCLIIAEESATDAAAQARWLDLCDTEALNLRAAIDHLVDTRQADWAARLTTALLPFWQGRARLLEAQDALTRALALSSDEEVSQSRARALWALSTVMHPMGDAPQTEILAGRALAMYRTLGDRPGQAVALNAIGVVYHRMQRYHDARAAFEESVSIWRELGQTPPSCAPWPIWPRSRSTMAISMARWRSTERHGLAASACTITRAPPGR